MSPRSVLALAAVTLVACIGAVIALVQQPETSRITVDGEPAFPTLRADPDAVAGITVSGAGEEVVLERAEGGGWVSATHDGYPADDARVRSLVVALSDMQLIEAKTSDPERFARLQLEDPEREDATSRRLAVRDREGRPLAEVIVGKSRNRLTGTEPAGTYIRRPDEQQTWLATGAIDLPEEPDVWLERLIVDLRPDEVAMVEVTPPGGPGYALRREEGDGWSVTPDDGESTPVAEDGDPSELAGALAELRHQGIRRGDEVAWPERAHRLRFAVETGFEVILEVAEVDGDPWMMIEAAPELDDAGSEAIERARAISARTEGWAYTLPASRFERLVLPLERWIDDGPS